MRELFTHGGSGTYIRKGEGIVSHTARERINTGLLTEVIEESFARKLKADWWQGLSFERAIITQEYRAAAIVTRLDGFDVPYLDKFAVAENARGEGLAKGVWQRLASDVPVFFLRSRRDNGFNEFYQAQSDGFVRKDEWIIFWKGDVDLVKAAPIIEHIASLPESFE